MFDNETHILNSTDTNSTSTSGVLAKTCLLYSVTTVSIITFMIGVMSWILINQFRHFRNYIFLSIIFNNIVNLVMSDLIEVARKSDSVAILITGQLLFLYFRMSAHCWLSILCWLFYVDLVKVFNSEVAKKYLKISVFAWGVPVVILVICIFLDIDKTGLTAAIIYNSTLFLPLLINLLVYLRVLYALFKNVRNTSDRWHRVQIATAIFLVSGILFLLLPFRLLGKFHPIILALFVYLPPIAMDVYFFVVRSNREVWKNYYERHLKGGS